NQTLFMEWPNLLPEPAASSTTAGFNLNLTHPVVCAALK
ncbi:MAG: hypothetical protein RL315_266, partial [Actinomycetota bacterium]